MYTLVCLDQGCYHECEWIDLSRGSTPLQPYQYNEEGFGEEEDGGGGVFEEEEDAGGGVTMLDTETQELSPEQYGQNSPMKGARKRASKGYHGVVWGFTKRLLDPTLMDMHANNKGSWIARFTHVCTRCWRKLTLGYDNETGWWKTTRAVAHSKKYHANDCKVGRESTVRESLCWIRMTRTARQDARRSGKEDAGQSLFWKNASSDFTGNTIVKLERGLVGT